MSFLEKVLIKGFKSIREQELELGKLNVFIGGNGVGKSNFIEIFRLLNKIVNSELKNYTGECGGANNILYFGRKKTESLYIKFQFANKNDVNIYEIKLAPTTEDRFIFENETSYYWDRNNYKFPKKGDYYNGNEETKIFTSDSYISKYLKKHFENYRIYHFHDTSKSAPMKQTGDIINNRFLQANAGNLAAYLYFLQKKYPNNSLNIEQTVQQIAPFFKCFNLAPDALNPDKIKLTWEEKSSDILFNASSLSDGTLRFICLATLLLQPDPPSIIIIDEPELGLHPAAIQHIASLFQSVCHESQIIISTQSVTLINQLEPEHVWVVDRQENQSVFKRLDEKEQADWLEDYALGDLWEKNILGGRP